MNDKKKRSTYLVLSFAIPVIVCCLASLLVVYVVGERDKKEPIVIWSQADHDRPDQIMASFEKTNYIDAQQLADRAVQSWHRENLNKEISAASITVILTVSEKK